MGYTHYWRSTGVASEVVYGRAKADMVKIIKHVTDTQPELLANGMGEQGTYPDVKGVVSFNGVGDDAFETFYLPKKAENIGTFAFCKTGKKPYDFVVVACLQRLNEVAGIVVTSDGDDEDLVEGIELYKKVLGR